MSRRSDRLNQKTEAAEEVVPETVKEDVPTEEVDTVRPAFDEATKAGKDEDGVKLTMISAGATFKNVTRLFNAYMIDAGLALSKDDRDVLIKQAIEENDVTNEVGFTASVVSLKETVPGMTDRSSAALIRAYAKKNELECYAKPKTEGTGKSGFATGFYAFLVANPTCTVVEATAYVNGEGDHEDTSVNVQKHLSHYLGVHKLVNTVAGVKEVKAD